jgi:competence protein ComEA
VYVPRVGEENPQPTLSGGVAASDEPLVDINTATLAELETLPHIGPATAQRIVEYRENHGPFETVEEIMEVPGIGPATFEEIRNRITAGGQGGPSQ